jgi:hypothetical protein
MLLTKYAQTYEMLKAVGHSPAKAAEIVLDASRGVAHALRWIRAARTMLPLEGRG